MKYVIAIGDGMADEPREDLGGKTPLQYANIPNIDSIAKEGICRMALTVPTGMAPGSDVANMSILGYDPKKYYTGRAPIEAVSMGVALQEGEIAFRCNFVTTVDGIMDDYSAGHIETSDAVEIIKELQALDCDEYKFYPGTSYRHLLVVKGCGVDMKTTPPHDISEKEYAPSLPVGTNADRIIAIMEKTQKLLADSPTNKKRIDAGKKPVTTIWPWGEGTAPKYPTLEERYGITGAVVSAVDLVKGLGYLAGMEVVEVEGATGYLDTNYAGKVEATREALKTHDVIYLHIEAPDETSHEGSISKKLQAIEDFDKKVVGEVIKMRAEYPDMRIIVMPDHPTLVSTKTHASGPVPFCISGGNIKADDSCEYDEIVAENAGITPPMAEELFDNLIKGF